MTFQVESSFTIIVQFAMDGQRRESEEGREGGRESGKREGKRRVREEEREEWRE